MGDFMKKNKKLVQVRCVIGAFLFFLSVFLFQFVAASFGMLIYSMMGRDTQTATFIIFVSMLAAMFSIVWFGYWYHSLRFRIEKFSYRKVFSGPRVLAMIGIGIGGCVSISILLSLLNQFFPSWLQGYENNMSLFSESNQVLTMMYTLLIAPVSEELVFRGVIMNRFCMGFSFLTANVLQAALFGLFHMNLVQGLYAFILGMVLGLIWLMTETIFASMAVHMLFNTTNVILQWIFPEGKPISTSFLYTIFLLSILFFTAGLWYTIRKCLIEEENR